CTCPLLTQSRHLEALAPSRVPMQIATVACLRVRGRHAATRLHRTYCWCIRDVARHDVRATDGKASNCWIFRRKRCRLSSVGRCFCRSLARTRLGGRPKRCYRASLVRRPSGALCRNSGRVCPSKGRCYSHRGKRCPDCQTDGNGYSHRICCGNRSCGERSRRKPRETWRQRDGTVYSSERACGKAD